MSAGSEVSLQGQSLILPDRKEMALTLDQRAMVSLIVLLLIAADGSGSCNCCLEFVLLSCQLIMLMNPVDFDYFSRHSGSGYAGVFLLDRADPVAALVSLSSSGELATVRPTSIVDEAIQTRTPRSRVLPPRVLRALLEQLEQPVQLAQG
jgi:hypothetical protein